MINLTEELIRTRAYELWKAAGEPEGNGKMDAFWYEAERQLLAERAEDGSMGPAGHDHSTA
jgi:Protein of unknown function (DUF2934)